MKKLITLFLLLSNLLGYAQLPSYLPSNGLVGWWPFNGNANDESGNGNNATVNGASLSQDRLGNNNKSYFLNGQTDYLSVPVSSNLLTPAKISVSLWCKIPVNYTANNGIGMMIRSRFYGYIMIYDNSTKKIRFETFSNGTGSPASSESLLSNYNDGRWHHLVGTFDGALNKLYIDGQLISSTASTGTNITYSSDGIIAFGRDGNNGSPLTALYQGNIDDIGIWNRALTQQEITALYTGTPTNACVANIIQNDTTICTGQSITLSATANTTQSVTDISGNTYPTVNIGNQTWMQKNLTVSRYRNGDIIPQVTDPTQWANLTTGAWCWYNNDSATYGATFGKLYNWYAVNDPRGLAPSGWHIPNDNEWLQLTNFLGGDSLAGCKMKATGIRENQTGLWYNPNSCASNTSGFTALPAGCRDNDGGWGNIYGYTYMWSSNPGRFMYLAFDWGAAALFSYPVRWGYSVRPVSDNPITYLWSTGATTPTINVSPTQSTTYYVTVSNGISTCRDSVRVNVTNVNRNFFPQDTIKVCGTSVTLDAGAGNSYSWNTGATTRTINVTATGRYRCTVTTGNCSASDSIFVSLVNANIVNNDTTVCSGTQISLFTSGNSGSASNPLNLPSDSVSLRQLGYITGPQNDPNNCNVHTESKWVKVLGVDSVQLYTVQHRFYDKSRVYDKNNQLIWEWTGESVPAITWYGRQHKIKVSGNDSIRIEFFSGYPNFCVGSLAITRLIFSADISSVLWSTGATTSTINVFPTQSTTYYVTVSNGISSCRDSVRVNVTNVNRNFFPQDTIKACGTSVTLDAGAGNSYSWSTGATTRTINVTINGRYRCTVTTNNCSVSDSVFVSLVNANIVNSDTTICSGSSMQLSALGSGATNSTRQLVDEFTMTFGGPYSRTLNTQIGASYSMVVSGIWAVFCDFNGQSDAAYAFNQGPAEINPTFMVWNGVQIRPTPNVYNPTHVYNYLNLVATQSTQSFNFTDNPYGDNCGSLSFSIYKNTPSLSYRWSTGDTTATINVSPTVSTTYYVTVSNGISSCRDSVRVNVSSCNNVFIQAGTRSICGPTNMTPNTVIDVPVTVRNFRNMVTLQGTVRWDSTVLRYQSVTNLAPGIGLTASNFNASGANNLLFGWLDNNATGVSLPDSSVLFTIRYTPAATAWNRSTNIEFVSTPNSLEAYRAPATLITVVPTAGRVSIGVRPVNDTVRLSGCGTVRYNTTNYTASTAFNDTLRTAARCDSIFRRVIITVNPVATIGSVQSNSPVILGDTIRLTVNGQNITGGSFDWSGPNNFRSSLQNPTLVATTFAGGQYRLIFSSTCRRDTQTVTVVINAGISGRIISPLRNPVSRVNLRVNNTTTLVNGSYRVGVPTTSSTVIRASKNNDVNKTNGVTVIDILLIQDHILQRNLLNAPYKIIAADANRSATISMGDVLFLRRLILGLDTTLPGNQLWSFVDSSYTFPNPSYPFPYKDSLSFTSANLQTNRTNQTFIGMKLGDVNYDWNYLQLRPIPTQEVTLYHEDVQPEGNTIRIPVKVKNLKDLMGMQFTLQYNSQSLRFRTIENNRLNLKYGNTRSGEGLLSFIWSDDQNLPATISDDAVLMELVFDKTGEFSSEDIQLVNTIAPIEAWDKNYRKHNIIKGRGRILNNIKPGTPGWTVSPNPTTGQVVVNITLQKAQAVELYLTSADGRVLKTWKQSFAAGTTAWALDLKSGGYLPAGMYWLKMPGVDGVVRKIVVE